MGNRSKLLSILYLSAFAALLFVQPALSQRVVFDKIQVRISKSGTDRKMVESPGLLMFDDTVRKLVLESSGRTLQVGYDDISNVVFDSVQRLAQSKIAKDFAVSVAKGTAKDIVETIPYGKIITRGTEAAGKIRELTGLTNFWMEIEIKMPDGSIKPTVIEFRRDDSSRVITKAQQLFGNNVHFPNFPEIGHEIEKTL